MILSTPPLMHIIIPAWKNFPIHSVRENVNENCCCKKNLFCILCTYTAQIWALDQCLLATLCSLGHKICERVCKVPHICQIFCVLRFDIMKIHFHNAEGKFGCLECVCRDSITSWRIWWVPTHTSRQCRFCHRTLFWKWCMERRAYARVRKKWYKLRVCVCVALLPPLPYYYNWLCYAALSEY